MIWNLLVSTLRAATPLLLAALGGIFSERSGVVNIALEGIMLIGAFAAVYGSFITGSAAVGLLFAVVAGMALAAVHAVASIQFKANQVVSGTAINLLAAGLTEFGMIKVWGGQSPAVAKVPEIGVFHLFGWTLDLGQLNWFVVIALALMALSHYVLWKTPWGLRLRAVGEHPRAAATVGVSVYGMRYWGVLLSGFFAGLAGASLSIGLVSQYISNITAGRGFIALAAMIFGKWKPVGALWACLLFGLTDGLGTILQIRGIAIPNEFMFMAPYVVTMLALAGVVGRATAPAADGLPYDASH